MLTLPPDPYLALGVSREAQLGEIRTAYRKLVLKCHPDKIQDPLLKQQKQDEFQKVQQAYELLSNETEKNKYDDMYKLNELQKEMSRMSTSSTAQPRSSRREREPEYYNGARVYTAEPRPSTFASPSSKTYAAGTPPSRSYEEFTVPIYDHHPPRKTASYERAPKSDWEKRTSREEREDKYERKSKKEDKREREEKSRKEDKEKRDKKDAERREKERRKEKEERKEREEKERKEKKKKVEQTRKKDAEYKTQQQKSSARTTTYATYSSDSDSDDAYRTTRKTSGTREKVIPVVTSERERKYSENMDIATDYLERSGARISLNNRPAKPQATEHFQARHAIPMAAPTPPPPPAGPHAPPPPPQYEEDEAVHRSSATKSGSRRTDKSSSAKKSARGSSRDPAGIDYIPRGAPSLQKSHTMPPEYHARVHPGRSHTEYTVRPSMPAMTRAHTFMDTRTAEYARDRSPTRHRRTHYSDDDEDSDGGRRHRRSKHRSPEPTERTFRYAVDPGKTSTRQVSHEDIPRQKSSKSSYHTANTSARMEPAGLYDGYPAQPAMKVRYSPTYAEDEIKYSPLQHAPTFRSEYVDTY
ncbi:uncharacterized protein B0I36DRAFT_348022 [Microdochium trichocladiopsis]|uniref:J domain-containing protein n=1 Tax=Microdochium trichocladiopsis TaxID=1682393 RepID=A0A9P8Y805_9PEZI|nr:uncharacterized protein B0I36DRAFT_348022 [Microdochium trichocladiopsis]KAH7032869.1 hypothetical protein B0I36DRAFT_348022 [Microdochium trichocladiopsis]